MNSKNDRLWRELACRFVQTEGEILNHELSSHTAYPSPALDARVQSRIRLRKAARIAPALAALAACFIAVLMMPALLRMGTKPATDSRLPGGQPDELIPLSFTLPSNLSVTGQRLDNGQSIYTLTDTGQDHVVLVMERASLLSDAPEFTSYSLNGSGAFIKITADYKLLTFEKDGIVYTLTCRYELDTLAKLGENIV